VTDVMLEMLVMLLGWATIRDFVMKADKQNTPEMGGGHV
jgi:hypothetical protein